MSDSPDAPRSGHGATHGGARLDSWKAIAAYFDRTVRTVRRWEAREGLPVHRHLHRERGSVYAYTFELDTWRAGREPECRRQRPPTTRARRVAAAGLAMVVSLLSFALWQEAARESGPQRVAPGTTTIELASAADARAQDLYREGRLYLDRRVGADRAREVLEAAVRLAPDDAKAHATLGEAYVRLASRTGTSEFWSLAQDEVRTAMALSPDLAQVHAVLGALRAYHDWDLNGARRDFQQALALDPLDPHLRSSYAGFLRVSGRLNEAVTEHIRVCQQSPLEAELWAQLGLDYEFARQNDDAIRAYGRALELRPQFPGALDGLADSYQRSGRPDQAGPFRVRALAVRNRLDDAVQFEERWRRDGYAAAARWLDVRNLELASGGPTSHWDRAWMLARVGRSDDAFSELEAALSARETGLLQLDIDPDFDALRQDRRLVDLARRVSAAQR